MSKPSDPIAFSTRLSWRRWLEENHDRAVDAWLVIRKKRASADCISLEEAVLEALCFGWIDSQLQTRNESTYALRFSPRKPESVWSVHNIRRVEQLIASGQMTEAGLEKVREGKESGEWDAAIRREQVDVVPADLEDALRQRAGCLAAYHNLPASRKQQLVHWLESAKRPETRERRIKAIIEQVEA
jgi:uncharacterized protein YdeI (YjbR/CyaY-like superfamily)